MALRSYRRIRNASVRAMDRCETSHLNCEGLRRTCDRTTFSGYEGAAANSARSRSVITQANAPELNASTVSDNPSGAISALSHCQNEVIAALPTKNIRVGQGGNVPEQRHLCGEAQQASGEARGRGSASSRRKCRSRVSEPAFADCVFDARTVLGGRRTVYLQNRLIDQLDIEPIFHWTE